MRRGLLLLIVALAACSDRQVDTLDTRDFTEPCEASCSTVMECEEDPAFETFKECVEDCNNPALTQWIPECEELAVAAWLCSGELTCEEVAASEGDWAASPCAAEAEAFALCLAVNAP